MTNLKNAEAVPKIVCATLFCRWGNQENVFKYQIAEFGLDDLWEYNRSEGLEDETRRSEEDIPIHIDHPNPDYTKLTRQISAKTKQRIKLLARHGVALEKKVDQSEDAEIPAEMLEQFIKQISSGKDTKELKRLNDELSDLRAKRALEPKREVASTAGYKQLRRGVSHIVDSLKMVVYEMETRLFEMLGPHYPNQANEGRKLIVAALRTAGTLRVEGDKIVVRLEAQASPNRTRSIDKVCGELNALRATYPGTGLRIEFDTAR